MVFRSRIFLNRCSTTLYMYYTCIYIVFSSYSRTLYCVFFVQSYFVLCFLRTVVLCIMFSSYSRICIMFSSYIRTLYCVFFVQSYFETVVHFLCHNDIDLVIIHVHQESYLFMRKLEVVVISMLSRSMIPDNVSRCHNVK